MLHGSRVALTTGKQASRSLGQPAFRSYTSASTSSTERDPQPQLRWPVCFAGRPDAAPTGTSSPPAATTVQSQPSCRSRTGRSNRRPAFQRFPDAPTAVGAERIATKGQQSIGTSSYTWQYTGGQQPGDRMSSHTLDYYFGPAAKKAKLAAPASSWQSSNCFSVACATVYVRCFVHVTFSFLDCCLLHHFQFQLFSRQGLTCSDTLPPRDDSRMQRVMPKARPRSEHPVLSWVITPPANLRPKSRIQRQCSELPGRMHQQPLLQVSVFVFSAYFGITFVSETS